MEDHHGKMVRSKCKMYDLVNFTSAEELMEQKGLNSWDNNAQQVSCKEWQFDRSFFKSSIIYQWNLTCDNSWLVSMSQSIYMAGFLLAVLFFGQLGDKIGRRPVLLFCVVLQQIAGFALTFSNSFTFYVIGRFFLAMGTHGLYTTGFVVLMEIVGAKYRPKLGIMLSLGWATGFMSLPGLGWLTRSWFSLQLVVAISSLSLSLFWWLQPESPRWLITQGRFDEAQKILEYAAKVNRKYNENTTNLIQRFIQKTKDKNAKEENKPRPSILDLLKTPNIRKKSLNMFSAWFVTSFVYYGLSLNTHDLGGDPLTNIAIAGVTEYPSVICGYLVIRYLGRRKPLCGVLLFAAISCLLTIPIGDDMVWLRITLAMLGKAGVSMSFGILYIFTTELFPTVIRSVALGTSSMVARIGAIVAPFIKELGHATNPHVPLGVFGGVTLVSALLVLLLPDTMNEIIPDSIEEAEEFGNKKPKREVKEEYNLGNTIVT